MEGVSSDLKLMGKSLQAITTDKGKSEEGLVEVRGDVLSVRQDVDCLKDEMG